VVLQVWQQRLFYQESLIASPGEVFPSPRAEWGVIILLALAAGTIAKLPQFVGFPNEDFFYSRNIPFVIWPALSAYLLWRNRQPGRLWLMMGLLFVMAAAFINLLPERKHSDTLLLSCLHLPVVLWCVTGLTFAGGTRSSQWRWQYLKFNGEWVVYTGLLLIGGMILTALTMGLFKLINMDIEGWYGRYVVVYGAAATPIVGAYAAHVQTRMRITPVVAKIFSPLVLVTLAGYLGAMAIQRRSPFSDREFLLVFNAMLLVVLAIIVFAISERDTTTRLLAGDYIHVSLIVLALILDVIALSAIFCRLKEYGFSPNRLAVLGANLVVCGNLAGLLWHYLRFVRGKATLEAAREFTGGYMIIQAIWAAVVTMAFPFIFWFR